MWRIAGSRYYVAEFISPDHVGENLNGVYTEATKGQVLEIVGFTQAPVSDADYFFTQKLSILYQGWFSTC